MYMDTCTHIESRHLHHFFAIVEKNKERENAYNFALIIETLDEQSHNGHIQFSFPILLFAPNKL